LPNGWNVRLEGEGLHQKTVSAISEDLKRESVIKQILLSVGAQGYFYKKLKMLVVRDNAKVAGPNKTLIALLSGIGPISL
jgi:hypothetical protein